MNAEIFAQMRERDKSLKASRSSSSDALLRKQYRTAVNDVDRLKDCAKKKALEVRRRNARPFWKEIEAMFGHKEKPVLPK